MSELSTLITTADIRLDVPAGDWREAISAAGHLLEAGGAATSDYTASMIATVQEHGPYIVIAPGFALAHARPDSSVRRTALTLVRLAEPIPFGHETNDPVQLVMALAARDADSHRGALATLAGVLADPNRRRILDHGGTPQEVLDALMAPEVSRHDATTPEDLGPASATEASASATTTPARDTTDAADATDAGQDQQEGSRQLVPSKNLLLTVCGNGLGTSLFLKNTAEKVLDRWGWGPYLTVEATDTISAKGKAKDADLILTSGAIADALGDVGTPVHVISDFTNQSEIDAALRRWYAV